MRIEDSYKCEGGFFDKPSFIYVGLTSRFLKSLRTKGLSPVDLKELNVDLIDNKKAAIEQAKEIAEKEGGSPMLVAVEFTDFNIKKYKMTTDSLESSKIQKVRPAITIPWNFLRVMDVTASTLPSSISYKGQIYKRA